MVITATGLPRIAKAVRRGVENSPVMGKIRSTSIGSRYLDDPLFRSEVSLYVGLAVNLAYSCINLFFGVRLSSIWFISLAAYYIILSAVRFRLLAQVRRSPAGKDYVSELKSYRFCGIMLLVLNLALCAIVTLVVLRNEGFEYVGNLIYAMAAYVFYSLIVSVVSIVKFRKFKSPVMSAAKALNLTASMVAMLSLETAMISRFGSPDDGGFRLTMTAASGFCVCAVVLGMAVFMMIRGTAKSRAGKP